MVEGLQTLLSSIWGHSKDCRTKDNSYSRVVTISHVVIFYFFFLLLGLY